MEEAQKLCDRIAIMDNGKIIALDTPQGLINQSGINSKIEFKVLGEMRHNFAKTCGVKVIKKDHRIIIESKNPEHDLHKLMECIEKNQIKIVNLIVHQPTLEDVFLKLTGKKLRE
jgi:ABC-2 type transport system ATP-binding protein